MASVPNCGIDVVAVSRIGRLLTEFPHRFREYAFTEEEQSYCDKQRYPEQHYAARWAVKEAYLKASPNSETNRDLSDVAVIRGDNPHLRIKNKDDSELQGPNSETGVVQPSVTMTHERQLDLAIGFVCMPLNTATQRKDEAE